MLRHLVKAAALITILLQAGCTTSSDWNATLNQRLPEYGHRNWIVVADSAYPKQSAPGIETLYTDAGQIEVLQQLLRAIDSADHIQPIIMLDAELESVLEEDAPGVDAYRTQLRQLLGDRPVKAMPHEDIIDKLDGGAELFNILILKTDMIIPYTSVFIELDCGYWNAEKEAKLRDAIKRKL